MGLKLTGEKVTNAWNATVAQTDTAASRNHFPRLQTAQLAQSGPHTPGVHS